MECVTEPSYTDGSSLFGEEYENKTSRYVIVQPVSGGPEFWYVNDMVNMYAVSVIHKSVKNAEYLTRQIYAELVS